MPSHHRLSSDAFGDAIPALVGKGGSICRESGWRIVEKKEPSGRSPNGSFPQLPGRSPVPSL
jgi:hypothetical protein